jgi:hypothetical protein
MFTAEERDRIREQLLARAETDSAVVGAAFTGSHATGDGGRWWQAEHWISAMRDHVITLACVRLGYPAHYAKGAHLLPEDLTTLWRRRSYAHPTSRNSAVPWPRPST